MKVHTAGSPAANPPVELRQGYRTRHGAIVDLRISSRYTLSLLQTQMNGLAQEDLPAGRSLGADEVHFAVHADRRERPRRGPASVALFFLSVARAVPRLLRPAPPLVVAPVMLQPGSTAP